MSQRKHSPEQYRAMKAFGLSNREIARQLGVNESTVRRGLGADLEAKRARDRKYLTTTKGRARKRRFRLREHMTRLNKRLKEKP